MSSPIVKMYYVAKMAYEFSPTPNISYNLQPQYSNNIIVGYTYTITLNGYCMFGTTPTHRTALNEAMALLNNAFNSNGGYLKIVANHGNGDIPILYATNILVNKVTFNEGKWSRYIPYTIELTSNHLFTGGDLSSVAADIERGVENSVLSDNLDSEFAVNTQLYKIKSFTESFDIQTDENQVTRTNIFNDQNILMQSFGGEYFRINYNVSAVGKQDVEFLGINDPTLKLTLPAWEHAKRFVHAKLSQQLNSLFVGFLNQNGLMPRDGLHSDTFTGPFEEFTASRYGIYNESFDFSVSESDGSFDVKYSAMVKRKCLINENAIGVIPVTPEQYIFCKDNVLHTITHSVNHSYNANEEINMVNRDTEIQINGKITGLVPGGGLYMRQMTGNQSRIQIHDLQSLPIGSFLVYNTSVDQGLGLYGGFDRNYHAELAFDAIFDYYTNDLIPQFKTILGITPEALSVSPTATLRPSRMNITRNHLEGTIEYNATYDNKFNCEPNNFEIQLSIREPNPVIAQFTVPNNNLRSTTKFGPDGKKLLCPAGKGYNVVQLLGTSTAKEIDVTINGNISLDFNRCCLGTNENWNLIDYDFLRLESFAIPAGVNIPIISDHYVLTKSTKTVGYPKGELSINLTYICADVCEVDDYFTSKRASDDSPLVPAGCNPNMGGNVIEDDDSL